MGKHKSTLLKEREPHALAAIEKFPEQFRPAIDRFYRHPETKKALITIIRYIPSFGLHWMDWKECFHGVVLVKIEAKYWKGRYPSLLRDKKMINSFADRADSLAKFIEEFTLPYDAVTDHPRVINRPRFDRLVYAQRPEGERWVNIRRVRHGEFEETKIDGCIGKTVKVDENPADTTVTFAFRPADMIRYVARALRLAAANPPVPLTAPKVPGSGNASSPQVDLFIASYTDLLRRSRGLHKTEKGRPPWNRVIAQLLNAALNLKEADAYTAGSVKAIVVRLERDTRRRRAKKTKEADNPKF